MTTTVVRAVKTSQKIAASMQLESWGRSNDATGDAQTSGRSLLPQEGLPGFGVTGVWESTPGSWLVDPRPLTEVAFVLSGTGCLTDADGQEHELAEGDVLILPVGWSGRWTILTPLRKFYVIAPAPGS